MSSPLFVTDGRILWLTEQLVGSPPAWQPGYNYQLGDIVVPTSPTAQQLNLQFQCVGFIGTSGGTQPDFPGATGDTVVDNQIVWTALNPAEDPPQLPYDQYYIITPTITISSP